MNPFFNRKLIKDKFYFFNRESELEDILKKIQAQKNILIYGISKVGLSSLLFFLSKEIPAPYIAFYIDLNETEDLQETLLNKIKETVESCSVLSFNLERANTVNEALYLLKVEKHMPICILDHVDYIKEDVLEELKTKVDKLAQFICGISLFDYEKEKCAKFYEDFDVYKLSLFKEDEAKRFLHKFSQHGGVTFSDADIDFAIDYSGTHPFYLQITAYYLFELKTKKQQLSEKDYYFIEKQVMAEAKMHMHRLFNMLTSEQQLRLFNIVEGRIVDGEVLKRLHHCDLLKSDGSVFCKFFEEFIRQRLYEHQAKALDLIFAHREDERKTFEVIVTKEKREIYNAMRVLVQAVENKDKYTIGHSDRVTKYATLIGERLNLSQEELDFLRIAARLHDIGKIGISELILLKTQPLTQQEYEIIKLHPQIGCNILEAMHFPHQVVPIVLFHHERLDGSGYPHGLYGDEIPLCARILAVADVFDAMTSERAYRLAKPLQIAIQELEYGAAAMKYDDKIVTTFLKLIKEQPLELPSFQNR